MSQDQIQELKKIAREALENGHDDIAERAIVRLEALQGQRMEDAGLTMSADEAAIRYPMPDEQPIQRKMTGKAGYKSVDPNIESRAEVERLRLLAQENPEQAALIASTSPLERKLIGVGAGMNEMLNLAAQYNPQYIMLPDAIKQPIYESMAGIKELEYVDPSAETARTIGQVAPLATLGTIQSIPRTFAGRLTASVPVGAAEGAALAEVNDESVLAGAVGGAILAPVAEIIGTGFLSASNKVVKKWFGKDAQPLDADGNLTPEFYQALEKQGVSPEQFMKAAESKDKEEFLASMVDSAQMKRYEDIASQVKIDPKRAAAAETLGIDSAPLAVMSNQPKVYELGGALAAQPTSAASESFANFNDEMATKADDLIRSLGGSTDKAETSKKILGQMEDFIAKSAETESAIHEQIVSKIGNPVINPKSLINDILESAKKSKKGVAGLSEVEQEVFETLKSKNTYYDLDNLRKKIGAALGKETSTYSNTSRRDLSAMYSKLTQLQGGVAKQFGADDLWNQSKEIAKKRFEVQDAVVAAFGRDKMQSIIPKVENALLSTAKNHDIGGLVKVMRTLEPEQQKEVMATALNSILTPKNAVDKAYTATHLQKIGDSLERSPTAKGLIQKYMGEDGYKRLDAMIELSRGISNVSRNKVKTGIYPEMFKKFENTGLLVKALYGSAGVAEKAVPFIGKPVRKLAVGLEEKAASGSTINPAIDAADNLMSSNDFRSYVYANAKGDEKEIALRTARLKKSKEYQEYVNILPKDSRAGIASAGLLPFLYSYESDEE